MQSSPRRARRIADDLRPARPLACEKLSDPILVRRSGDADRRTEPLVRDTRVARDADLAGELAASESRREPGRRLAELPSAQATVVALKDASDVSFEISSATGMPVGTAKCYAHRGRSSLREQLTA